MNPDTRVPRHDADITLIADPAVAAIPVHDCEDPLVDLCGLLSVDTRRGDPQGMFTLVRSGVRDRLDEAEKSLPRGIHLLVVEAFRPISLQRKIYELYRDGLLQSYPGMELTEADIMATRYVAPVGLAPHTCGAAVDLTLCDSNMVKLDMGCEEGATPEESAGACYMEASGLSASARENRAILRGALTGVGMVNYPTEWWHWSFGDRYWALVSEADHAVYGPTHPDGIRGPKVVFG